MTSTAPQLNRIPLFADLPKRLVRRISSRAIDVEVPAGRLITSEGGPAREFCIIVRGSAELRRAGRIARLRAGDCFGGAGMLSATWTHAETVVTTSPTRLLVMGRREFAEMTWELPAIAERIRRQADETMAEAVSA